jgi:hypothetical protein
VNSAVSSYSPATRLPCFPNRFRRWSAKGRQGVPDRRSDGPVWGWQAQAQHHDAGRQADGAGRRIREAAAAAVAWSRGIALARGRPCTRLDQIATPGIAPGFDMGPVLGLFSYRTPGTESSRVYMGAGLAPAPRPAPNGAGHEAVDRALERAAREPAGRSRRGRSRWNRGRHA